MDSGASATIGTEARLLRHRAGRAWTDRGNSRAASRDPGRFAEAAACHRLAIRILSELPVELEVEYRADLGAAWGNLACALDQGMAQAEASEADAAHSTAIEVLESLPWETHARFRHNLAAAWMNRGDSLSRSGAQDAENGAREAYARAVRIAEELPLDEKASFRVLLASCLIKLGASGAGGADSRRSLDRALRALGDLPSEGHRLARYLASSAHVGLAEALLAEDKLANAEESADSALKMIEGGKSRPLDPDAFSIATLRALTARARALERQMERLHNPPLSRVSALTDTAEKGLDVALAFRARSPGVSGSFYLWFFALGGRAYGRHQPQFLLEFLAEGRDRWACVGDMGTSAALAAESRRALAASLSRLEAGRLLVAGAEPTERLLSTASTLRRALLSS